MTQDFGLADRVIPLSGVHNFRDYGGYRVAGGGTVRRHVLWRSGQHHDASDSDLEIIDGIGLTRIFDMRTDRERQSHPCRRAPGFSAVVHCAADASATQAPHVSALSGLRRSPQTALENMRRSYAGMPYRTRQNDLLRLYIAELAQGDGPSLIHCLAGKDRTGFAVAMLHHALGVHHDDILADYLLTNTAGDPAARIAAGLSALSDILGNIDEETLGVIMGVREDYLETALAAIRESHGSIDAYQADVLGLDAAMRDRLHARLIEG